MSDSNTAFEQSASLAAPPNQLFPLPSDTIVPAAFRFSCFRKLPPEIRLLIWELAIEPRVFRVTLTEEACTQSGFHGHCVHVKAQCLALPVIVQLCQEPRDHLRHHFRDLLHGTLGHTGYTTPGDIQANSNCLHIPGKTWGLVGFNPDIDTLELYRQDERSRTAKTSLALLESYASKHALALIKNLRMDLLNESCCPPWAHLLSRFTGLKYLTVANIVKRVPCGCQGSRETIEANFSELEKADDGWIRPQLEFDWHFNNLNCCPLCEEETGINGTFCRSRAWEYNFDAILRSFSTYQ